jgi:hypothetical protein
LGSLSEKANLDLEAKVFTTRPGERADLGFSWWPHYFATMTKIFKASARIAKFTKLSHIQKMSLHSLRRDSAARQRLRAGATLGAGLHFSTLVDDGASPDDFSAMRDLERAFKAHKRRHGIGETVNGGLGFHAMINVSVAWVREAGDVHDPRNPRNIALLREATRWVTSWAGQNSVYAARLDLDETGAAVVDVFAMAPRVDGRSGKLKIATSKALTELRLKHNERMSYVAMQTDWAEWCQLHLDPAISRGTPKSITKAEHLGVDDYKTAHALAQASVEMVLDDAEAVRERVINEANDDAFSIHYDAVVEIERAQQAIEQERAELQREAVELAKTRQKMDEEQRRLLAEREELHVQRRALDELRQQFESAITMIFRLFKKITKIALTAEDRKIVADAKTEAERIARSQGAGLDVPPEPQLHSPDGVSGPGDF